MPDRYSVHQKEGIPDFYIRDRKPPYAWHGPYQEFEARQKCDEWNADEMERRLRENGHA